MKETPKAYGYAGLFNNSNYLAAWLLIVLPFSIASVIEKRKKFEKFLISFLFLILICTSIIICFSRMGGISIPLHLAILFTDARFIIIIFLLILFTLFVSLNLFLFNLLLPIPTINFTNFQNHFLFEIIINNTINTPRLTILSDTLKLISNRPLMGWGSSTYPEIYKILGTRSNVTHSP